MTLHYHGTPISPISELMTLAGRNFCVSFARPDDVRRCHEIGQSVMLDNGAFSFWKAGVQTDKSWWTRYYEWAERWLAYPTTWAVIPDVIDGDAAANDELLSEWPFGDRGAPVWHMHEPIDRLVTLAQGWPRICLGSSAEYAVVGSASWRRRMDAAMNALCGSGPVPVWLHMLRGMATLELGYPFASADSTDVAQNHHRNSALTRAKRWDAIQTSPVWHPRAQQAELEAA